MYGWNRPTFFIDPTGHEVRDARGYTIEGYGIVTARDDTTVYANPTNEQLIEQYESGQITYDEAVIGQIGNQTRALATTTQDHQKSWTRNLVEETVSNIAWDVTSPAHDTLEGLATQDPKLIGYGLGKTAAVGALGVVVKEGAPVVVEKLVEKVPVLGKDVRQLAGKALSRAKAVLEGATEQAKRLLQAEIEFSPGVLGSNLGNVRVKIPASRRLSAPDVPGGRGRALEIAESIQPSSSQDFVTVGVTRIRRPDGRIETLVTSNERTLRPSQLKALRSGERPVAGRGHAEETAIYRAQREGAEVVSVDASRPVCSDCEALIREVGAATETPLKGALSRRRAAERQLRLVFED